MNTKLVASLIALVLSCLGASMGWAQTSAHVMVTSSGRMCHRCLQEQKSRSLKGQ
jgi:hypothetical protein